MKQGTRGEARVFVAVPAADLYALVSDVTRMGEWSPETRHCEWLDGASGPAVGARFKGSNRRGVARWSTKPRVVVADPGREFAFVTQHRGEDQTRWSYTFEPDERGTTVTESFEMMADMPWYFAMLDRMMGAADRKAVLEADMAKTLERVKAVAERSNASNAGDA